MLLEIKGYRATYKNVLFNYGLLQGLPLICSYVDRRPTDNAIKPDITIVNHDQKEVTLIEGTVCSVGMINQREERKTQKYEELRTELHKIYKDYKVKQINIVMDFLANFGKTLLNELKSLGIDSKETLLVLQQSQKPKTAILL